MIGEATPGPSSWLLAAGMHIGFGVGLFYAVKKFFEEVEKSLSQDTKLEIAIWVLDLHPTQSIRNWQPTFLTIFNTVFGDKHWSWKCFSRSCLSTIIVIFIVMLARFLLPPTPRHPIEAAKETAFFYLFGVVSSVLPDYLSLWKTRYLMYLSSTTQSSSLQLLLLILDVITTFILTICAALIGLFLLAQTLLLYKGLHVPIFFLIQKEWLLFLAHWDDLVFGGAPIWFLPAFLGRLWLLAYVISGLLLNNGRSFDLGFSWFNRRFDVENHALQSIGLVAGTLTAVGYWVLAIVHWVLAILHLLP